MVRRRVTRCRRRVWRGVEVIVIRCAAILADLPPVFPSHTHQTYDSHRPFAPLFWPISISVAPSKLQKQMNSSRNAKYGVWCMLWNVFVRVVVFATWISCQFSSLVNTIKVGYSSGRSPQGRAENLKLLEF